jgi:MoaA/NifB/PqqE/SkfB family radical SAM enzyme
MIAMALRSPGHPILAHIVPTRRCNLGCSYCNEYDDHSKPVPAREMKARVDRLAALGTTIITISGGEPLVHPDLDEIVRRSHSRGIITTLITNGYLLTPERIRGLNDAGLDQLQISIDNVMPDEVSRKSLKVLDRKLRYLAEHAEFDVIVNSVIGATLNRPEDALEIAHRAASFGFSTTVGVIHDGTGQLRPLTVQHQRILNEILTLHNSVFSLTRGDSFQVNLARGASNDWHCPAGGRYLYVCEDGLVHWCSQRRGRPGIPLAKYTQEDLDRERRSVKECAPYCTIGCVQRVAMLDHLREKPREALARLFVLNGERSAPPGLPLTVRMLAWLFIPPGKESNRRALNIIFTRGALRLFGLR